MKYHCPVCLEVTEHPPMQHKGEYYVICDKRDCILTLQRYHRSSLRITIGEYLDEIRKGNKPCT